VERRIEIAPAATDDDVSQVRELFVEYAESLGYSLCFQGFDKEIERLPQIYGPPRGRMLLARVDGEIAGCVALRRLDEATCEMKRLFVRPAYRGLGLGRTLAEAIVDAGRELGYARMRLDTLPSMTAARSLYSALGFREIAPYYDNPVEGARYLELQFDGGSRGAALR
jgi:ribosomal protein S18 acetylase RimI-like enzyme